MIVVFGATGTVGGEVLRALRRSGAPVRAVARTPQKADGLREHADEVVVADLAEPASLRPAVAGADAVFLASPGAQDQVRLEENLVDALGDPAGAPFLVKLAAAGYDQVPPGREPRFAGNHARVVGHVRERGLRHAVVAPSGFMTNLLLNAGTIREQGAVYGSAGDGGLGWVDPADIGEVAARVLLEPERHLGASYTLTGPEVLNHAQVAERMTQVLGREVRYVDVPPEAFEQGLRAAGLPEWNAGALTELNQLYRARVAEGLSDDVRTVTGREPVAMTDWLQRHREAFV